MPPKQKKQRVEKKPVDAYFARLDKALADHSCKGSMLIKGIENENSDEGSDADADNSNYTAADVAKLRHLLINGSRDKALKAGHSFASCGQADEGFCMFNTSSGNEVVFGIQAEVKKALKKKSGPARFDALFGLTHGLKSFDFWMNDNECWEPGEELEQAIKVLAKAWKDTLKKSNDELGIDA